MTRQGFLLNLLISTHQYIENVPNFKKNRKEKDKVA